MALRVTRKEGESPTSFLYRFTKRVQQSGILKEARKRRFYHRPVNQVKVRLSALHREAKKKTIERAKKMGLL